MRIAAKLLQEATSFASRGLVHLSDAGIGCSGTPAASLPPPSPNDPLSRDPVQPSPDLHSVCTSCRPHALRPEWLPVQHGCGPELHPVQTLPVASKMWKNQRRKVPMDGKLQATGKNHIWASDFRIHICPAPLHVTHVVASGDQQATFKAPSLSASLSSFDHCTGSVVEVLWVSPVLFLP